MIDFISDIYILSYLVKFHPAWASISICTMISPFFAAYVPFANFLIRGERLESRVMKWVTVIPVIIFIMILLDQVFVIQGVIYPIVTSILVFILWVLLYIAYYICLGLKPCFPNAADKLKVAIDSIDLRGYIKTGSKFYNVVNKNVFDMTQNDSNGNRSQRVML